MVDLGRLTAEALYDWTGHLLDPAAEARIGPDLARQAKALQAMTPPSFSVQAHDFQPLFESLADDFGR